MHLCRFKLHSCKPVARKKLHIFSDEQSYVNNLTHLYIYNQLDEKIINKKKKCDENINKYVGKIAIHLKLNKENCNIIFSLPTFLDIFFFNYFKFNLKSKLIFLSNFFNIKTQKKNHFSLKHEKFEKKKVEILTHLCKTLVNSNLQYVHEIRQKYINKHSKLRSSNKKENNIYQNKVNYILHTPIPVYNKTFLQDLLNQTHNLKDLCIVIYIIRNVILFHTFDYSTILDSVLRKVYLYFNEISISVKNNYEHNLTIFSPPTTSDKNKIEKTKTVKIRDLIYSFYQLTYLHKGNKIQFLFLKILIILGRNYAYIGLQNQDTSLNGRNGTNEISTPTLHNPHRTPIANNLYLSNKDIEQLFYLLSKNSYLKLHFMHPLVIQFYIKLFSLDPSVIYFNKLIIKNNNSNYIFCPITLFPKCTLSYLEFLKKEDVKNYFHIFYQTICIKYLLKRKITFQEKFNNFHDFVCRNMSHKIYVNHSVFYKNIINKIINRSFNLYITKVKRRRGREEKRHSNNKWIKQIMNTLYNKFSENYIYDFTKCKFFYLIYIRRIMSANRRNGMILEKKSTSFLPKQTKKKKKKV
ncbi:hypothetical protein, conserved [Plasmodium gonderi]|uniref:Uncharacterized protein n=1 Tax=Plasmodium gonderi TaxID=77519 RepID=A0A1Y1JNS6_PLAGO|nr:hypothetical protein, conserved [Plasmodium gonderi]GAW82053.1 hypothetical protein, conserved [Plasmodium gonderi]